MRLHISMGCYSLVLSSFTNFPFCFQWDNFELQGGYPRINIWWKGFFFSVDDF